MEYGAAFRKYSIDPYAFIVKYIHNLLNKTNKLQNMEYDPQCVCINMRRDVCIYIHIDNS